MQNSESGLKMLKETMPNKSMATMNLHATNEIYKVRLQEIISNPQKTQKQEEAGFHLSQHMTSQQAGPEQAHVGSAFYKQ